MPMLGSRFASPQRHKRPGSRRQAPAMASETFDFTPLWTPGCPPAAIKWKGLSKYYFIGGNNDAEQVPLDRLVAAATAVLEREGRTLSTYGLNSGPQGYRPLREFLSAKLARDAGISC